MPVNTILMSFKSKQSGKYFGQTGMKSISAYI